MNFKRIVIAVVLLISAAASAQSINGKYKDGLKVYLSDDSVRYIKATGIAQIWVRHTDNNPGSTVYGTPESSAFDIGLRRVRYQVMSQVNKRTFFYTQLGINSFNSLAARKTPIFFHDVTAEYNVYKNYFTIGAGLSGWNGTSRYSSSGVGNILCLELPVIEETTNDVSDQFVRKLGVFAKGKIGAFDYRVSAANPFPVQSSLTPVAALPDAQKGTSYYSLKAPKLQYQGYFIWQFLDKESNQLPYMTGSYLGKKRVFNLGAGFSYQQDAMWYRNSNADTLSTALQQFGVDVFYDVPLNNEKQNAITAYVSYLNYNFGPNYLRNAGAMNTANGVNTAGSFNGPGNAFPLIGTGQVFYVQAAYLFRKELLSSSGTLQPYFSASYADYQKLNDPVIVTDIGLNWIMSGQNSKISLDYQSRPVFNADGKGDIREITRKGMLVIQYQMMF